MRIALHRSASVLGLALILGFLPSVNPARCEASYEFLFSAAHVENDTQFFLNLAVTNAAYPRTVIAPLLPQLAVVETDLPVVLFLARRCACPPEEIVAFRARGLSWAIIFGRVGVPYDVLFTGIDRDPGPPYGKAWGHWRKHGRRFNPDDRDVVALVDLQTARALTGVPVREIARARASGKPLVSYVAEERGRHGSAHGRKSGDGNGNGRSHGHKGK